MTSEILKVKKRFGYPPDLEETPIVNFFNLRNSKLLVFGWKLSKFGSNCKLNLKNDTKVWAYPTKKTDGSNLLIRYLLTWILT